MNAPRIQPETSPEATADGCCGSGNHRDHKQVPHDETAGHGHEGCGTSKASDAQPPADKRKPGHGSGCCCS
ncbi:MAG: hypothetical protein LCH69_02390 [Proteobacteria bacterium]|nr:hypothetical protein [Pseudomonadota bacterium]